MKSEEMKELEEQLKEKEAEILQLRQQISSKESSLTKGEISLPEKTSLLSDLTNLIEQLYKAQDDQQVQSLNLTLCRREADHHQKQAEELKSKVCTPVYKHTLPQLSISTAVLSYGYTMLAVENVCILRIPLTKQELSFVYKN